MIPLVYNKFTDSIPPGSVNIMRPSKWGNPFTVKSVGRPNSILCYEKWINNEMTHIVNGKIIDPPSKEDIKRQLRGKNLVCCCSPLPCHGHILLGIANA